MGLMAFWNFEINFFLLLLSMLLCKQNLVKFCPFVLKILSGNKNYDGITELQINRITD